MNNSRYHLLFLLLLSCYAIQAQKNGSSFIGIEAGLLNYFGDSKEQDFIRKEYNSWYSTSDSYASTFNAYYAGIKYEQLIKQDRIGWMTGLRFTKSQSSRGANESWLNDGDYFYVLYKSENTSTEYLKVREIQQETYYIGVPLEIRYLLFGPRVFRLYFKLGTEFNFRINTSNHFDFVNKSMNVYQQDLSDWVEKPGVFSSSIYGGVGMRFGKEYKPAVSIELILPAFSIGNNSSLVKTNIGVGLQTNIQVAYKKR